MAITLEQANNKLNQPLTEEELKYISYIESYIDDKITKDYKGDNILIQIRYVQFLTGPYNPVDEPYNFHETRRAMMQKELEKRYIDAGWNINYIDYYFILSGKN